MVVSSKKDSPPAYRGLGTHGVAEPFRRQAEQSGSALAGSLPSHRHAGPGCCRKPSTRWGPCRSEGSTGGWVRWRVPCQRPA